MIIQGFTWYKGESPALLLGVGIRVEDGSQPTLERVHDYLMFSAVLLSYYCYTINKNVKFIGRCNYGMNACTSSIHCLLITWIVLSF